jgi:hypothetical protein
VYNRDRGRAGQLADILNPVGVAAMRVRHQPRYRLSDQMTNPRMQMATAQRIPRSHHRSAGLDCGWSMLFSIVPRLASVACERRGRGPPQCNDRYAIITRVSMAAECLRLVGSDRVAIERRPKGVFSCTLRLGLGDPQPCLGDCSKWATASAFTLPRGCLDADHPHLSLASPPSRCCAERVPRASLLQTHPSAWYRLPPLAIIVFKVGSGSFA